MESADITAVFVTEAAACVEEVSREDLVAGWEQVELEASSLLVEEEEEVAAVAAVVAAVVVPATLAVPQPAVCQEDAVPGTEADLDQASQVVQLHLECWVKVHQDLVPASG